MIEIVEPPAVDLQQLHREIDLTVRQRRQLARVVREERKMVELRPGTVPAYFELQQPTLSTERLFTRVAQLCYGASDERVATILYGKATEKTLARVRQTRSYLNRRRLWIPIV